MKENDLIVGQPYLVDGYIYIYKGCSKDDYYFINNINDLNSKYIDQTVAINCKNEYIKLIPNYDYSKEKEITIKIKESDLEELERHNIKYKEL